MDDIFDLEKLKKDQEAAEKKKGIFGAIGSIGQGFADIPSSHELLYGGKSRRPDIAGSMKSLADNVGDPSERQAKLYQAFKGAKDMQAAKKQETEDALLDDGNSDRSKALMAFGASRGIQGKTGREILQMMDPKKITESEADFSRQKRLREMDNNFSAQQNDLNRKNQFALQNADQQRKIGEEQKQLAMKNDPQERLKGLNASDKVRFDNAVMVLKGLDDMGSALDKGRDTFSLVGDNDYTAAARRATEGYGRMQSGGAINTQEEERFNKTLPGMLDSRGMQRDKILNQRNEMIGRLNTLGFTPQDIGYKPQEFTYGKSENTETQFEADVIEYATKHGISPQAAKNIKEQRNSKRAGM